MTPSSDTDGYSIQQVVVLFGPPGSGKGTQASLIADKLNFYYLETSKLLEEGFRNAKEGEYVETDGIKYYLKEEQKIWASGVLNSPPFVTMIVKKAIEKSHSLQRDLLMAGSPRTLYEAEALLPLLKELYGEPNIKIIMLELEEEETMRRNTQRRICELMRHPILTSEETVALTTCPLDGSRLLRRDGLDDEKNIATRLEQYAQRTLPMLEYFESKGFKVEKINAGDSVVNVFGSILKIISS